MNFFNRFFAITTVGFLTVGVTYAAPTVTFQGEVTDQTCQASINGGTNGVVLLPTVSANTLTASGAKAGLTPFTINVTGCTAPSQELDIKTKFLGHSVTSNGNLGNVATVNAATNVAIQLTKEAAGTTAIVLNGPTAVEGLKVLSGATSGSYDFGARYISEAGGATQGTVTSVVEYTLSYQ
ncbi:fimbrial protein [Acinetobacter bereziniae]|uniref:fimbrial protein n=1 Tax=Acinetobacter bereziniae TaxID=106648 RepID=UPI00124FEC2D|nr:fimbrial protein [Acinetobacter bereziniae]